ncbi:MAG: type IV pilin-like G/H family protein [Microcystaceae cyanobacterium]
MIRFSLNLLKSVIGIRLFFILGAIIPLSVIPFSLNFRFPSFWGMVSYSRYSEGKTVIGALNRAQQAYFIEHFAFADNFTDLEVPIGAEKYYQFSIINPINTRKSIEESRIVGVVMTGFPNSDMAKNWHRFRLFPFVGVTLYDTQERTFMTRVCMADSSIVDLKAIQIFSSQITMYPYKKELHSSQSQLDIDDIFPCPNSFKSIQ